MTTTHRDRFEGFQRRDFQIRARPDGEAREITAIGVPYDTEITIDMWDGPWREKFAPGSVEDDRAILRYGHADPIGRITSSEDTPQGRRITATISRTTQGEDILTLVRDGVLDRMSIGFEPISHEETECEDGSTLITWTKVKAREYSIVEFPAYEAAEILSTRNKPTDTERQTPMDTTANAAAPDPVITDQISDLTRSLDDIKATVAEIRSGDTTPAPDRDQRSAGEFLRALVKGDEPTRAAANLIQERAFQGTTSAADASTKAPAWVGDVYRLIDNANPIVKAFSEASLPSEGLSIEYGRIKDNGLKVAVQANEGDNLVMGKLSTETATAPVKTFGGYTELSRQAIERTRANILDLHVRGMTIAAAAALASEFNTFYEKTVSGQASRALSTTKAPTAVTWADLNSLIVDASHAYSDMALALDGLIVDPTTFKALTGLTDTSGRPLFTVSGTGANAIGEANPRGILADLAGLEVRPNFHQTSAIGKGIVGSFYSREALKTFTSSTFRLQDTNVINLSEAFSIYFYAAFADEIPAALVPLKLGAE